MSSKKGKDGDKMDSGPPGAGGGKGASPGWATGLRQLYDPVLNEPLPKGLQDLLAQLDPNDGSEGSNA